MELTEGSETSANYNLTPGKYPKEQIHYSKHCESLKSRIYGVVYSCEPETERVEFVKKPGNWAAGKYLCEGNGEKDM
jgi:hypothetical protein